MAQYFFLGSIYSLENSTLLLNGLTYGFAIALKFFSRRFRTSSSFVSFLDAKWRYFREKVAQNFFPRWYFNLKWRTNYLMWKKKISHEKMLFYALSGTIFRFWSSCIFKLYCVIIFQFKQQRGQNYSTQRIKSAGDKNHTVWLKQIHMLKTDPSFKLCRTQTIDHSVMKLYFKIFLEFFFKYHFLKKVTLFL